MTWVPPFCRNFIVLDDDGTETECPDIHVAKRVAFMHAIYKHGVCKVMCGKRVVYEIHHALTT